MKNKNYKYDVAFAFLKKDEHLVNQINELVHNKFITFFYSKKLEEMERPNRELKIAEVIGKQSKLVVVFFRKKWGNSPWTKIEELAIRKRSDKEGYDFLLFIPLDDPPMAPKYVPKTQVWEGLADSGIKGAAAIIEERVKSFVDESEEKSNIKSNKSVQKEQNKADQKSPLLGNIIGLEVASLELNDLFSELKIYKDKIEEKDSGLSIIFKQTQKTCNLICGIFSIKFQMQNIKSKVPSDSKLYFEMLQEDASSNEPSIIAVEIYHFEAKMNGEYGWTKDNDEDAFITSKKLAEESINTLLNQAANHNESKKNKLK